MAEADSTTPNTARLDAIDTLNHAAAVAQFVQGISTRVQSGYGLHLSDGEASGLHFVMQDLIDRITRAKVLVERHDFIIGEVSHG